MILGGPRQPGRAARSGRFNRKVTVSGGGDENGPCASPGVRSAGLRALAAARPSYSAGDAIDLALYHALDKIGQLGVKPFLEHRAQHFADQVFQRVGLAIVWADQQL